MVFKHFFRKSEDIIELECQKKDLAGVIASGLWDWAYFGRMEPDRQSHS